MKQIIVQVQFEGSYKGYSYFANEVLQVGDFVVVPPSRAGRWPSVCKVSKVELTDEERSRATTTILSKVTI